MARPVATADYTLEILGPSLPTEPAAPRTGKRPELYANLEIVAQSTGEDWHRVATFKDPRGAQRVLDAILLPSDDKKHQPTPKGPFEIVALRETRSDGKTGSYLAAQLIVG